MMTVYALIISILLIISVIMALKWKISTHALIWFCKDKLVEPTEKEIADYTRKAAGKLFN